MNKLIAIFVLLSSLASAQEIRRATLDSNATVASTVCAGTNISTSSGAPFTNWYDSSGDSTSGDLLTTNTPPTGNYKGHKVTTWAAASTTYTALNLIVRSSATADGGATSGAAQNSVVQYSITSGVSWVTIRAGSSWAATDDAVALSASQSLATLQVRGCSSDKNGNGQTLTIYDIRTEGTLGGGGGGGGGGTHYVPTTTLSEIRDNNTSGCAATNAPSVGTTGCIDNFPAGGVGQTQFPISALVRTGGNSVKITIVDNYNFSTTQPDRVVVSGVSDAVNFPNGTYTVTSLGACPTSGDVACTVTVSWSGSNVSSSGGTATRYAQTAPFVPAPKNVANFTSDGIDPHLMPFLGGTGGTSTAKLCPHFMEWFATNGSSGNAIFTPANGTSSANLDAGMNISNGSHVVVGYASNSTNQVAAQINAMKRLNFDCLLADSYGLPIVGMSTQRTNETGTMTKIAANLSGQSAFQFAALIDDAGFKTSYWCGSGTAQTPSCVEKYLICSWNYYHFGTSQSFICPFNGLTYFGSGFFTNSAYLTIGGKPVTGTFMDESAYFNSCGAGCPVYNNGVPTANCTSRTACWDAVYAGVAASQSAWTVKPIYYWRNSFTAHAVGASTDQGGYRWINPTGDRSNTDYPAYDSFVTSSLSTSRHFMAAAYAHNDHAQSSFQDDNKAMEGYCGKTFQQSFARVNVGSAYTTANDFELLQILTWNDLEQGTMIENGIDSCYTISASIPDGRTLNYSIATADAVNAPLSPLNSTLHHVAVYVSLDGINVMQLPSITPAASGSIDMTSFQLDAGTYQVYVKLVPWTNMQTSITGAMAFTSGVVLPNGNNTNGSQAHRGTLTTRLEVK